ncbi:MAG TPA: hypothetical protein VK590_04055 [Saprospiraceae bacterium]|nr:hypothetical protein [Saprospiraceae bacterium]
MNIYARNLNYSLQEDELRDVFSAYGEVTSVKIIKDRATGRAKGYAFIEMPNDDEGTEAINALNGTDVKGRNIMVSEALPPKGRD